MMLQFCDTTVLSDATTATLQPYNSAYDPTARDSLAEALVDCVNAVGMLLLVVTPLLQHDGSTRYNNCNPTTLLFCI
eukprot:3940242-Rhodomonas_salina.3